MRKPGRWILLVLLLAIAAWGIPRLLAWWQPPVVTVNVAEYVPAGEPLQLDASASKDVDFSLSVPGVELGSSGRDWTVFLPSEAGPVELSLSATDSRGNVVEVQRTVTGVVPAELTVAAPEALTAGDALAVHWTVQGQPEVTVMLDGADMRQQHGPLGSFALVPVDVEAPPGERQLTVTAVDELGRESVFTRSITVTPLSSEVEVLQLADDVLALRTPDNQTTEEARLAEVLSGAAEEPLWRDRFLLPSQGVLTSGFGDARRYGPGGPVSRHVGSDVGAPSGTPIVASNDGVVLLAENLPLSGGLTVIDHGGGVTSHYKHQSLIRVLPGDRVRRGDVIGDIGSTGISTGPHLHWEMQVGGVVTNPLAWIDRPLPGIDLD